MNSLRDETAWLQALKAGDSVVLQRGIGNGLNVCVVDKVTRTQVVIGGSRFRRDTGREVGGYTWDRASIVEPTADRVHKARLQSARSYLSSVRWSEVSDATVLDAATLVESSRRRA